MSVSVSVRVREGGMGDGDGVKGEAQVVGVSGGAL